MVTKSSMLTFLHEELGPMETVKNLAVITPEPINGSVGALFKLDTLIVQIMEKNRLDWITSENQLREKAEETGNKIVKVSPPLVPFEERGDYLLVSYEQLLANNLPKINLSKPQDAMQLIPHDFSIPKLYETDKLEHHQKVIYFKLFTPRSSWTWWICEYDPIEQRAFGLCDGGYPEWGYVSIKELNEMNRDWKNNPHSTNNQWVERDVTFDPIVWGEHLWKQEGNFRFLFQLLVEWRHSQSSPSGKSFFKYL